MMNRFWGVRRTVAAKRAETNDGTQQINAQVQEHDGPHEQDFAPEHNELPANER